LFYTGGFWSESFFMSATAISVDAQRLPTPALRRFAWGVVVYFIIVFLGGTLVRATGAGAGCGDHWPLCNGTVVQHHPRVDTIIEFTHGPSRAPCEGTLRARRRWLRWFSR